MNLDDGEYHFSIVKEVIELYLESNVWYLPTSKSSLTNIADTQRNVLQICLMTEGLAQLVSSLNPSKQSLCLIHCLYPILERVGSEIGPISLAGKNCFLNVSSVDKSFDVTLILVKMITDCSFLMKRSFTL